MPASQPSFASRILLAGAGVVGLFCAISLIAILFSRWHPWFDLFTHMTWHLFWGATAFSVVCWIAMRMSGDELRRSWQMRFLVCLGCSLVFFCFAKPWEVFPVVKNDPKAPGVRIASWNVLLSNQDLSELDRWREAWQPDVIVLIELSSPHESFLKELSKEYPYCEWTLRGASGIGVFSKIPGTVISFVDLAELSVPAMEFVIPASTERGALHALAVHTFSPRLNPDTTWARDLQLVAVKDWAQRVGERVLVIGDLNITPWSYPFQRLQRDAGLADTRVGRGLFPTWPAALSPFGIPIDHALVSEDLDVGYRGRMHHPRQSDHRGIALVVQ
ncbi:MAG: endonuclease/exonuclease/phosphatase family protein [Pirellula sp.]|nr:endonuclease/exonuclease/phosphatase family protein [Pirellula sp.]